jgi:hypothetical protein
VTGELKIHPTSPGWSLFTANFLLGMDKSPIRLQRRRVRVTIKTGGEKAAPLLYLVMAKLRAGPLGFYPSPLQYNLSPFVDHDCWTAPAPGPIRTILHQSTPLLA